MIQVIRNKKKIYAIIVKKQYSYNGIKFFTPNNFSQQLGYMKRPKNYEVKAHKHNKIKRSIYLTQEVLFIKSGKVSISFFNNKNLLFKRKILNKGDIILLACGGHSLKMLKKTEIIEVKTGPYQDSKDKKMIKITK
tara:strand:+ start:100 stop:507 length:408 start_codon:yes stop_codon:yes gene_type:complete